MKKRKKYFIDRKVQGLYMIITAILVLLTSVSVGVAIYCLFFSSFTEQVGAINLVSSDFKIIAPIDIIYLRYISIILFLLSGCIGLFFVFFVHRIVGPLGRIQSAFDAVRQGDYSMRLKIRKHDYLRGMTESFNQMADSIEKRQC